MSQAAERARQGSRRQRDIDALAVEERKRWAVPDGVTLTPAAQAAWLTVRDAVQARLPKAAWSLYLSDMPLVGEKGNALYIAGHPAVAEWCRRKYAKKVGDIVRELTDYEGLFVCAKEDA